jgi:hypothetical protein
MYQVTAKQCELLKVLGTVETPFLAIVEPCNTCIAETVAGPGLRSAAQDMSVVLCLMPQELLRFESAKASLCESLSAGVD